MLKQKYFPKMRNERKYTVVDIGHEALSYATSTII